MTKSAPIIDMTPDGRFLDRPGPTLGVIALRILMFGTGLCVIAAVFWTMIMLLPALLLLAAIGYVFGRLRVR
jgi:hypothetical protein